MDTRPADSRSGLHGDQQDSGRYLAYWKRGLLLTFRNEEGSAALTRPGGVGGVGGGGVRTLGQKFLVARTQLQTSSYHRSGETKH